MCVTPQHEIHREVSSTHSKEFTPSTLSSKALRDEVATAYLQKFLLPSLSSLTASEFVLIPQVHYNFRAFQLALSQIFFLSFRLPIQKGPSRPPDLKLPPLRSVHCFIYRPYLLYHVSPVKFKLPKNRHLFSQG